MVKRNQLSSIFWCQSWWRHQIETFSALLAICAGNSSVSGEFPTQRPVTLSFDVYFDLRPNKRLSKQSWGWLFFRRYHSHYDVIVMFWWAWLFDDTSYCPAPYIYSEFKGYHPFYCRLNWSILWLLILGLLVPSMHQQAWCCLYDIHGPLFSMTNDFKGPRQISFEKQ